MSIQAFYRSATQSERELYQTRLYPLQDQVFKVASSYGDNLYLTGGTALARFYFQHRLSEDLDFFTVTNDLKEIANDLRLRLIEQGLPVEVEKMEIYFARFYVLLNEITLKVEFAKEFHLIDPLQRTETGIYINSLEDLGANKITAFEDRAAIKDIIDLYYITQRLPFERLFDLADQKRVPVAYENLLAINSMGITGQALITKPLPDSQLVDFVATLKQQTEAEVKKKEQKRAADLTPLVKRLLWDFPAEERKISNASKPVLKQRLGTLPLPDRRVLAAHLSLPI